MAKKVFIGVGHGGSDPGAVANGFYEKNLNLVIATACNAELVRHGVQTMMSRTKDENDSLTDEIRECNVFGPDLCIDIHNNAGGGDGAEAFYYSKGGVSKTLAQNVLDAVVAIGQNSRGIKTKLTSSGADYYGFIRETYAPACIVECAFVDNINDLQIIDTEAEQKAMGVAIAKGILKTLGIAYNAPVVTPAPAPAPAPVVTQPVVTTAAEINGFNIPRAKDYLVIYNRGNSTGTNKWGAEVAFNNECVAISDPIYGVGNMQIPSNGFVLSGHDKGADWILANVKQGKKISVNLAVK
jgi:N-acetylmuramoyl-L-alanine amidase